MVFRFGYGSKPKRKPFFKEETMEHGGRQSPIENVTDDVRHHMERILDYLRDDELKHCRCAGSTDPHSHIFSSLAALRNWIDAESKSVHWYLQNA